MRVYPRKATGVKSNLENRVRKLENKTKQTLINETFRRQTLNYLSGTVGNCVTHCINSPDSVSLVYETGATYIANQLYQSYMRHTINFSWTQQVPDMVVTLHVYILKGKSGLNAALDGDGRISNLIVNKHFSYGISGVGPISRITGSNINPEMFKVVAVRRITLGNITTGTIRPTVVSDTHRELQFNIRMKTTLRSPNASVFSLREQDIPPKDRYYSFIMWDQPADTTSNPEVYITSVSFIRTIFSSK